MMIPTASAKTPRRRWRSAAAAVAVTLVGTWLSACKTVETTSTITEPYDYRERHPIRINEGVRTVELFIGRRRATLTPAQRRDVGVFAENWHGDATGGIEIRVPTGTANERSARDTVPEIEHILAAVGVPKSTVAIVPVWPADPAQLLPIVLAYPRLAAQAGPCGLWPNDIGPGAGLDYVTNAPYWNLGCATQRNLAAMVDDPADLVQPRGETPPYAERRAVALDRYHKGQDTTSEYRNDDKAKISDVGK